MSPAACRDLGEVYERGELGAKRDAKKALEFYERACQRGTTGCIEGAAIYAKGSPADGLAPNPFKAESLLDLSCKRGNADACLTLADVFEKRKDPRAKSIFEDACRRGRKSGCEGLKRVGGDPDTTKPGWQQAANIPAFPVLHVIPGIRWSGPGLAPPKSLLASGPPPSGPTGKPALPPKPGTPPKPAPKK
jgi:hypothetical protein